MLQATQLQAPAFPQQAPAPFVPFAPVAAPPAPGFDIMGAFLPIIMMAMMFSLIMPMMKGIGERA